MARFDGGRQAARQNFGGAWHDAWHSSKGGRQAARRIFGGAWHDAWHSSDLQAIGKYKAYSKYRLYTH